MLTEKQRNDKILEKLKASTPPPTLTKPRQRIVLKNEIRWYDNGERRSVTTIVSEIGKPKLRFDPDHPEDGNWVYEQHRYTIGEPKKAKRISQAEYARRF